MGEMKLFVLLSLFSLAHAGSNGAYPGACRINRAEPDLSINMIPSHPREDVALERTNPESTMEINKEEDTLNITISSENKPFIGFLIVVQDGNEKKGGKVRGKFLPFGFDQKGLRCDGDDTGLTHSHNGEKTSVTGIWQIPEDIGQNSVVVRATVLYEKFAGDHLREKFEL